MGSLHFFHCTQAQGSPCPLRSFLADESLGQVDAGASAGLLVDALLAVDQGAPAAMLGSHASGAAAVLLNLFAPLLQLVQGEEAEARALAPGVVLTSTGARPCCWDVVLVLCLPGAEARLLQRHDPV